MIRRVRRKKQRPSSHLCHQLQKLPFSVALYSIDYIHFDDVCSLTVRVTNDGIKVPKTMFGVTEGGKTDQIIFDLSDSPSGRYVLSEICKQYFGYFRLDRFRKMYQVIKCVDLLFGFYNDLKEKRKVSLASFVPLRTEILRFEFMGSVVPWMDFSLPNVQSLRAITFSGVSVQRRNIIMNIWMSGEQAKQLISSTRNVSSICLSGYHSRVPSFLSTPEFFVGLFLKELNLSAVYPRSFEKFCKCIQNLKALDKIILENVDFFDPAFSNVSKWTHLKPKTIDFMSMSKTIVDELLRLLSDNFHCVCSCRAMLESERSCSSIPKMKNLKYLDLECKYSGGNVENIRSRVMVAVKDIMKGCKNLTSLNIFLSKEVFKETDSWDAPPHKKDVSETNIPFQELSFCMIANPSFLEWMSSYVEQVSKFSMFMCSILDPSCFDSFSLKMKNLRVLRLKCRSIITETMNNSMTTVEIILANCKNLKCIEIGGETVTFISINVQLNVGTFLESLDDSLPKNDSINSLALDISCSLSHIRQLFSQANRFIGVKTLYVSKLLLVGTVPPKDLFVPSQIVNHVISKNPKIEKLFCPVSILQCSVLQNAIIRSRTIKEVTIQVDGRNDSPITLELVRRIIQQNDAIKIKMIIG